MHDDPSFFAGRAGFNSMNRLIWVACFRSISLDARFCFEFVS